MNTRMVQPLGAMLFLLLSVCLNAHGGDRRRVRAVSPPSPAPSIAFLDEGGLLEIGTVTWSGGRNRSTVTARTVRMRIGEPTPEPRGNVALRAFVEAADPRCTVRVDGIALTAAPRVIRRNTPVGVPLAHRIEVEVPVTAADGPLHVSIGWEATTE